MKRLAKIYPVYLAGFAMCFVIVKLLNIEVEHFFEIMMMNILLVQSYLPKFSMAWYGGGSWSISTEFFFYLCFPLLLNYVLKLSKRQMLLSTFLVFMCSCLPGILFNLKLINFPLSYTFPPSRIWEFLIGMLTAALVIKHKVNINNIMIFITVFLCAVFFFFAGRKLEGYVIQNVVVVPLMIVMLISVVTQKKNLLSFLGNGIFEYLGKISYSFYIVQIPILIILQHFPGFIVINSAVTFCIILCINLLCAVILFEFIELPFHKILNKKIKTLFLR